jgi:endonuclease YncB( thermonuclease family)
MTPSFTYAATVERVVDADTLDVAIDLGFRIQFRVRLRVAGIDAPELHTAEGKEARLFVLDHLCTEQPGTGHPAACSFRPVVVRTYKPDKYGRALADVQWVEASGRTYDLAGELLAAGRAQLYTGGARG